MWNDLSINQKSQLMSLFLRNGIDNINSMRTLYDSMPENSDFRSGGGIHIKPENRGKFTALKERTGKSASWFKAHGTPAQRKMATFALNARKWHHADGGYIDTRSDDELLSELVSLNTSPSPFGGNLYQEGGVEDNNPKKKKNPDEQVADNTRVAIPTNSHAPLDFDTYYKPYGVSLKDLGYRIMSQSSSESRSIGDVLRAVGQAIAQEPVEHNYTGSNYYVEDERKANPQRDLNYLVMYGNKRHQFTPKQLYGFDYSNYLKRNYGVDHVPAYEGQILPSTVKANIVPLSQMPLVRFLAEHNLGVYSGEEDQNDNLEAFPQFYEEEGKNTNSTDDVGSYRIGYRMNPNTGNPELQVSDLVDYGGNDAAGWNSRWNIPVRWGHIPIKESLDRLAHNIGATVGGKLLSSVINSPVILDQGIPVFPVGDEETEDLYSEANRFLKEIVSQNNVVAVDDNGDFEELFPMDEVTVIGNQKKKKH